MNISGEHEPQWATIGPVAVNLGCAETLWCAVRKQADQKPLSAIKTSHVRQIASSVVVKQCAAERPNAALLYGSPILLMPLPDKVSFTWPSPLMSFPDEPSVGRCRFHPHRKPSILYFKNRIFILLSALKLLYILATPSVSFNRYWGNK